jgi:hypothetical protein
MTPDEYIVLSGYELTKVENPVAFLADFYCNVFGITRFKELYPAIGKLVKYYGIGKVYEAIIENYYRNSKHTKDYFYRNLIFTIKRLQQNDKMAREERTPPTYKEYLKLRESVNV